MRALSHENLLRIYTSYVKPPTPCLVTELMAGALDSMLWGRQAGSVSLTAQQRVRLAAGIARGMAYLHRNNVAHRDLKSGNVLYDPQLNVKLCDFAFSKVKELEAEAAFESTVGTPAWMAPEVLRGREYTMSADCFSYGVILWELAR